MALPQMRMLDSRKHQQRGESVDPAWCQWEGLTRTVVEVICCKERLNSIFVSLKTVGPKDSVINRSKVASLCV